MLGSKQMMMQARVAGNSAFPHRGISRTKRGTAIVRFKHTHTHTHTHAHTHTHSKYLLLSPLAGCC